MRRGNADTFAQGPVEWRVGIGLDVHAFADGRPLRVGGVHLQHPRGLAGHSDADVLLHAIADALLGAAALGDIGHHFPPSDPRWKDADSRELLRQVVARLREAGWRPINVDATVIADEPKLGPYRDAMRTEIAACLGLGTDAVEVKATTAEGLGFVGRGEGMAALAVVLIARA
ncbi:MAG: 2-C-methyl-D-erythritol 2,4-cyclodiphosphate synthase [Armatimonadetes bacterium]|nr:2-C-methyl-D-erythritol 2,4-cyclodiphosphate synthase [Armatimonadota bacterium]